MLEELTVKLLRKIGFGRYAAYPVLGVLPTEIQEQISRDIGSRKYSMMLSQIAFAAIIASARYLLGESVQDYPVVGYAGIACKIWSYESFISNLARMSYSAVRNRPIGILSIEIPCRLVKKLSPKARRIIEKYGRKPLH